MSFGVAGWRSRFEALRARLLSAVLILFVAGCSPAAGDWRSHVLPERIALRSALESPDAALLRQAYAARGFKPIWMGHETRLDGARQLVSLLETSRRDGLSPAKYHPETLKKRLDASAKDSLRERMRTDLLLTAAYVEYVHDLHTPSAVNDLRYADRDLQPQMRDRAEIARDLADDAWPQTAIEHATRMNGLYVQMRDALAHLRSVSPRDSAAEARLVLNLDRLRALPSDPGDHFVLVDVAAGVLWLYEDGRPVDSMKVVVGAQNQQTPQLAGLIRYAIYNPFWNVPPDLTRDTYAPRIVANSSALADLKMDAWSGFTANAQILDPKAVDWRAVSRGEAIGWLRQRPGPHNSMGAVKFMLPNELGIYLHDTPHRELFDKDARFFSAGCIRVEDYRRLSRWLFRGAEINPRGRAAEQRFDLQTPVPVYIVYLTARANDGVVQIRPDVYGRDRLRAPVSADKA